LDKVNLLTNLLQLVSTRPTNELVSKQNEDHQQKGIFGSGPPFLAKVCEDLIATWDVFLINLISSVPQDIIDVRVK
jgi:hypothetical protein